MSKIKKDTYIEFVYMCGYIFILLNQIYILQTFKPSIIKKNILLSPIINIAIIEPN